MTTSTLTLADFLLARIAEDEATNDEMVRAEVASCRADGMPDMTEAQIRAFWEGQAWWRRRLAECEAKRRIVERESQWYRTKDNVMGAETSKSPIDAVTVQWMDENYRPQQEQMSHAEFRERFTEPSPPSATLKDLALPYADHPDYDESWRP